MSKGPPAQIDPKSAADYLGVITKALVPEFKYLGDFGAYYTLYVVGRPVPEYEEARALIESRK